MFYSQFKENFDLVAAKAVTQIWTSFDIEIHEQMYTVGYCDDNGPQMPTDISEEEFQLQYNINTILIPHLARIDVVRTEAFFKIEGIGSINMIAAKEAVATKGTFDKLDNLLFIKQGIRDDGNALEVAAHALFDAADFNGMAEQDIRITITDTPLIAFRLITVGAFLARFLPEEMTRFLAANSVSAELKQEFDALMQRTHVDLESPLLSNILDTLVTIEVIGADPVRGLGKATRREEINVSGDSSEGYRGDF